MHRYIDSVSNEFITNTIIKLQERNVGGMNVMYTVCSFVDSARSCS